MGLMTEHITVTEITGEDASGVATTRITTVRGYHEYMDARSKQDTGVTSADAAFTMLDASGFGDVWDLNPGDKLTVRGVTVGVISRRTVYNPRTGALHHIEATSG